ncbi:MAG: DUF6361 family protein [Acidimicrobiales bacterium]
MPSVIGWLDQSEEHQRKMREVIDLFSESDARDELGIAAVRDAFSDMLFPGLSTIQTRARYFFFVPWGFEELEQRRTPSTRFADKSRELQTRLIFALIGSGETQGVIGIEAQEKLKRLPDSVYWNGLWTFGIRKTPGNISDYQRGIDRYYRRLDAHRASETDETLERRPHNWHLGLPAAPEGWLDQSTLALTGDEADFLRERMVHADADSMLAWFLSAGGAIGDDHDTPWALGTTAIDGVLGERLRHARYFSEMIWGAALLYNVMLAAEAKQRNLQSAGDGLEEHYRSLLDEWRAILADRWDDLSTVDRVQFWSLVRKVNPNAEAARSFIDSWLDLVHQSRGDLVESPMARELIADREYKLKRGMARLGNPRQLELWGGAAGVAQLVYRWGTVRTMVNDIVEGLADARS